MTGKEALKEIRLVRVYIDEFCCAVPLKKVKEYKIIENELDELTKYKRAFEILKDKLGLEIKNVNNLGRILHKLYYRDDESTLEQEEAKLLEELMNCGTKDN